MKHNIQFEPQDLAAVIAALDRLSPVDAFTEHSFAVQAELEIQLRKLLISKPNNTVKMSHHPIYLKEVRGENPPEYVINFLSRKARTLRLTHDRIALIERNQCGRCASCGTLLTRSINPHVDHIVPIEFGGEDDVVNMQILCESCNLGKGALIHWVMAAPWFIWNSFISKQLRYCVLARDRGSCSFPACQNNASNSELSIILKIPKGLGGRPVFDNLQVLCTEHEASILKSRLEHARSEMKKVVIGPRKILMPVKRFAPLAGY